MVDPYVLDHSQETLAFALALITFALLTTLLFASWLQEPLKARSAVREGKRRNRWL
jgi:hypothetical protein